MKFRLSVIGFFFVVAVLAVQLCAQLTGDTVTVPSFLKKEKNVIEFNDADWSALFDGMVRLQNDTDTVPRVVAMVHIGDSHSGRVSHRGCPITVAAKVRGCRAWVGRSFEVSEDQ